MLDPDADVTYRFTAATQHSRSFRSASGNEIIEEEVGDNDDYNDDDVEMARVMAAAVASEAHTQANTNANPISEREQARLCSQGIPSPNIFAALKPGAFTDEYVLRVDTTTPHPRFTLLRQSDLC